MKLENQEIDRNDKFQPIRVPEDSDKSKHNSSDEKLQDNELFLKPKAAQIRSSNDLVIGKLS